MVMWPMHGSSQEIPAIGSCPDQPYPTMIRCGRDGAEPKDAKQIDCTIISPCMGRFALNYKPKGTLKCNGRTMAGAFEITEYSISFVPQSAMERGVPCVLELEESSIKLVGGDGGKFKIGGGKLTDGRYSISVIPGVEQVINEGY